MVPTTQPFRLLLLLSTFALALAACQRGDDKVPVPAKAAVPTGLHAWTLPAGPGASAPDLALAPDDDLLLAWLDAPQGRRTRF